jgi:S-DNA-T family DNA segregation ATPase FtsK/SpoIIIE
VRLWVANSDRPFGTEQTPSVLIDAPSWDFWDQGIPVGADARGGRQVMHLLWSSLLIGGLQGYGKSYFARLVAAAAALDPRVRIVVITGKAGPDWAPLKHVAHDYLAGNSPAAVRAALAKIEALIEEMGGRGEDLERLFEQDPEAAPEGKITLKLADDGMGPVLLVVDELQELLDAAALMRVAVDSDADMDDKPGRTPTRSGKDVLVEGFARYVRVARFVGGMGLFITQRPDANSVPTALREVCAKRASYRVKGSASAKMVLGDDAVNAGAAPHMLTESSRGVLVLDAGQESGHVTLKADTITVSEFREICLRARALREAAGTLTGYAASYGETDPAETAARRLLTEAIDCLDAQAVDRARTERLVELLKAAHPERYGDLTGPKLQAALRDAGAGTTRKLGPIDGMANPNGYTREQLADALNTTGK